MCIRDRLFDGFELAAAHNHVDVKHAEYFEHVGRVKDAENKLAAAKEAQERLAATLRTRNADAFHASVALAGAMLKALLGEDRAPRLRVAAGVAPPAWLVKAEALDEVNRRRLARRIGRAALPSAVAELAGVARYRLRRAAQ